MFEVPEMVERLTWMKFILYNSNIYNCRYAVQFTFDNDTTWMKEQKECFTRKYMCEVT